MISKNRFALASHISRFHTNPKQASCNTCHRVFSNPYNLRIHIKNIHNTKERHLFPCTFPGCEKTYLVKGDVVKHVETEHAKNPVRYPCGLCGHEFKKNTDLERHMATHTTEKVYKCSTCERDFTHVGSMKRD